MSAVTRRGDWARVRALISAGPARLKGVVARSIRQEAEGLRREIVQGLTRQAPGGRALRPPAETTLATRRLQGFGGRKSLLVRGDLRNSVTVKLRGDAAFIGVPRAARGHTGQPLIKIAELHEFGSAPTVIPMSDAMRRFIFAVLREAGAPLRAGGGSGGRRGLVVVQIPARPFLRPAFEAFQRGAEKRFLTRVAAAMRMGGL